MAGRMFGKRWYGQFEFVPTKELKKRLAAIKRTWVSVKTVPVVGGGHNVYVWGRKKKK